MRRCKSVTKSGTRCERKALPGRRYCWQHESKFVKRITLGTLLVVALSLIGLLADLVGLGLPVPAFKNMSSPTQTPTLTLQSKRVGKPPGDSESFSVYPSYDPSGYVGDISGITVETYPEVIRFIYETREQKEPCEWEWKYVNGQPNLDPCQFAGVMYLNPPNNWGEDPNGGFDLRSVRRIIEWEARSVEGEVNVEFVIGGVTWIWDNETKSEKSCSVSRLNATTQPGDKDSH